MVQARQYALSANMVLFVLMTLLLFPSAAWSSQNDLETTVHAIGSSDIRGADLSASRNAAIAKGLVSAVIKLTTDMVPSDTVVGHFQVINEQVLSQTDQFIRDYKMLTESIHAKQHRVIVQATVSVQKLKKVLEDAGIYIGQKSYPSILYCIAEKQVNDLNFQYWWGGQQVWQAGTAGTVLHGKSEKKGLVVRTPDTKTLKTTFPSPQLSVSDAAALGREMQADIVVIGEAIAEESANTIGSSLTSYRGSISIRAYKVLNVKEIGQAQQVSTASAADPMSGGKSALEKASVLASEDLLSQIVKTWFAEGAGASTISVQVEGLSGNIANFVRFRGTLSAMSGVDSVQRKEMQSDTAVLLVDYQGNIQALADALMRQNYGTFSLNISEPAGNTLRVQLVSR